MTAEPSRSAAPRASAEDFWRLLAKSELLAADRIVALRVAYGKMPQNAASADGRAVAKWLIGQGAITRYHAQALLSGQVGPFRFGDYVVLEPIEAGPLTGQFRGRSIADHREVTLRFVTGKELKRPEIVARLRETLATWRRLAGPELVVGQEWLESGPYKLFVTEPPGGESLAERLKLLRVLPSDRACQFVAQLAQGIAGLHREGIAHGSIRTDVAIVDKSSGARLLGFPLTRDPLASAGVIADAPPVTSYDAPELQAPPHLRTPGSDVFALGAVLYELLTGQRPQPGASRIPPDQINPAVPAELSAFVGRCLDPNPAVRPRDATEFAQLLAPWSGETSTAAPAAIRLSVDSPSPRIEIQTGAIPAIHAVATPRVRSKSTGTRIIAAAVILIALAIAGAWGAGLLNAPIANPPNQTRTVAVNTETSAAPDAETIPNKPTDGAKGYGEPLWERPYPIKPWNLAYVPSGAQMIVVLRPQALLENAEGEKLASLPGPSGEWLTKSLPELTGFELSKIEHLTLAFLEEAGGALPVVAIMHLGEPVDADSFADLHDAPKDEPPAGFAARTCGQRILLRPNDGALLISLPESNPDLLQEIAKSRGAQPNLRPQFEALLPFTAEEMDVAVLAAPSFLYETLPQFTDSSAGPVWALLETWLGRDARGVLASASLRDGLFWEVRLIGDHRVQPRELAEAWQSRLASAPRAMSEYLETRALIDYSRSVLLQFGQMLQVLAGYTRLGEEQGQLVVRGVLPDGAAHNLYLAGYLAACEPPKGQGETVAAPPSDTAKESLAERLKRRTSLNFPNNSLETSLQLLADDLGFRVRIEGNDLKIDGITKNQAIRDLNEQDRPAEEILRTILKKANPAGKLVYLPKRDPATGEEILVITTRAAAAQRGETLPPELSQP